MLTHLGADAPWQIPPELLNVRIHSTDALEMPDVFRWYVSSQWLDSTRRLNEMLGGSVSHWIDSMTDAAARTTLSRRLLRELNRSILSIPEKLAYAAYDTRRQRALVKRLGDVLKHDLPGGVSRAAAAKVAQPAFL